MPDSISPSFIAIADFVLKSFMILLAAFAADFIFRKANAKLRHALWMIALLVVLLLPFITNVLPKIEVPLFSFLGFDMGGNAANADLPAATGAGKNFSDGDSAISPGLLLTLAFYLAGLAVVAIWQFVGRVYAVRLKRSSKEISDSIVRRIRAELADELKLKVLPKVMISSMIKIPFTTGIFKPVVILPAESTNWPENLLRSVIAHEMAHIKRRDLLSRAVGQISCCINWFNPLAWFGLQNILVEQEFACDNHVISSGAKPSEYAENLLEVANIRGSKVDHALATMGRKEGLKSRLVEILSPKHNSEKNGKLQFVMLLLILGLFYIPAVMMNPWAPVASAEKEAEPAKAEEKAELVSGKDKAVAIPVDLEKEAKDYINSVSAILMSGKKLSLNKARSIISKLQYYEKNTKVITPKHLKKYTQSLKNAIGKPVPANIEKKSSKENKLTPDEKKKMEALQKQKKLEESGLIKKKTSDGLKFVKKETPKQKDARLMEEAMKKKLKKKALEKKKENQ